MLTWHDLEGLRHGGRLKRWETMPPRPGHNRRFLYLDPDIHEQISKRPWPDSDGEASWRTAGRRQAMRSLLDRFGRGDALNLGRDMKEMGTRDKNALMRGFWEFRSQGDMSQTRLFGFFARRSAFIGLRFRSRDGMEDQDFEDEHAKCKPLWAALANDVQPLVDPWPVQLKTQFKAYTDE